MTHGLDTSFLLAVEIAEHAHHAEALRLLGELPQVLTAFLHVVTDARRFQQPFSMETALNKSEHWWNAAEADQVLPTDVAIALFHTWMRRHQLGRKRVLDTLLAATYRAADVTSLLTLNATDFTFLMSSPAVHYRHSGAIESYRGFGDLSVKSLSKAIAQCAPR